MLQNISVTQLVILLAIVLLVFGTKRLRNLGGDLGTAIKGFRKGMSEDDEVDGLSQPEQLKDNAEAVKSNAESKTHSSN